MRLHLSVCYVVVLWLVVVPLQIIALYPEDAGVLDFLIETAGHGVTRYVKPASSGTAVLTSDSFSSPSDQPTSCYVAFRTIADGTLLWRRNVCSVPSVDQRHAVAVLGDRFFTVDHAGIVRAWNIEDGSLLWDAQIKAASNKPQLWTFQNDGHDYVSVASSKGTVVLDTKIGQLTEGIRASGAPQPSKERHKVSCEAAGVEVRLDQKALKAGEMEITGDIFVPDEDVVEVFEVLSCNADSVAALLSTASGTTTLLTFTKKGNTLECKIGWTTEEGLASITSAVILDATHLGVDDLVEEQDVVLRKLTLPSRLNSQIQGLHSLLFNRENTGGRRDHIFGFVKVAALLSQKSNRLWGMSLSGNDRGSIRWSIDLPKTADWHTMVHGTVNSPKAVHGINGGTHSREILVLSSTGSSIEWNCVDGTTGAVHAKGFVPVSSPVAQILPIYGSAHSCRQASLLFHEDRTFSVVPADKDVNDFIREHARTTPNGMFTHIIDKSKGQLVSFQISPTTEGNFKALPVGQTSFPGERIMRVTYPIRDEIVQSMCAVLGDDSLLLKYINPHMAVIVTMAKEEENAQGKLASTLASSLTTTRSPKKRKPAGVGDVVETDTTKADPPNMFVNIVDTVSGRLLHRISHTNGDSSSPINVLISENWVVYSFTNRKTRRTELGVLTLHEGMIDSKGLTLFSSPEQTESFSSLDARESKPVVLSKTYTYPKAVTAIGATSTRGGISNRRILLASADGKITAIDRKLLETRRPTGEVKEAEKMEGLFQ